LAVKEFAERNKKDSEVFFAANRAKEGVIVLPSGLQYRVLKEGDGKRPSLQDKVVCHYRGTLIDGTEFDSSYSRQQPAIFAVSRVIKGWTEALQLMPVGSKWQLFVPPNLAYGERGSGRIGPDATLLFEVELLSIQG
jgi:FKBP-type peptidyl-prolyl cis-trans isomerase FklB